MNTHGGHLAVPLSDFFAGHSTEALRNVADQLVALMECDLLHDREYLVGTRVAEMRLEVHRRETREVVA